MSSLVKEVPERIKRLREDRGYTQNQLGVRAGLAPASVSHFETGQRLPSLESLMKIADALDVSVDTLLGRSVATQDEMDPIFMRASRSGERTLNIVRRVTQALLDEEEK